MNSGMAARLGLAATGAAALLVAGCKGGATSDTKRAETRERRPAEPPAVIDAALQPAENPATVLVDVDGTALTLGEADARAARFAPLMQRNAGAGREADVMPALRRRVAEEFVVRTLLGHEAERQNTAVSEDEITNALAEIRRGLPPGLTLEAAMEREGMSPDTLRSNLVGELRVRKLVAEQIPTNAAVSEAQVAAFYASEKERFTSEGKVHARHVLIKTEPGDTDEIRQAKKAKAEAILKQIHEGADFETLAREQSDCPSKTRGGDLGTFGRGEMVKAFEDAVFAQPTNAIGPVVETPYGYHVIQVLERTEPRTVPLEELRERIVEFLQRQHQQQAVEAYVAALRQRAHITYDPSLQPPPPESGAVSDAAPNEAEE
jgi:peptidyl-prolyl cis-trans isomerase C